MKRMAALLLLTLLLPALACAQTIERVLMPDLSNAPWCEDITFDMLMEQPKTFPSPVPMYQTKVAQADEARIRSLLETCGMPVPQQERWYNGADFQNRRSYVFGEMNHGRYQLYSNPWGMRSHADWEGCEQNVCRNFLAQAGLTNIEEPYYRIQRGNAENAEKYTGIGFRFMLEELPVAMLLLDEPGQSPSDESLAPVYGSMTISAEGLITQFDLWNMPEIVSELESWHGPLCTWEEAVCAVLNAMIHHTSGQSHWLDDHERLRVVAVEPNLALTPAGTTFPVWAVVYEAQLTGGLYSSGVQYVDARSGEMVS